MKTKIENKTILIFQLLLAIAVVFITFSLAPPALQGINESLSQQVQQAYNIGILNIQSSNINITYEKEVLDQIYNEELNLINNLTTNNG